MGVVVVDFVESWPGITLALGDLCRVLVFGLVVLGVGWLLVGEMRLELNAFANHDTQP